MFVLLRTFENVTFVQQGKYEGLTFRSIFYRYFRIFINIVSEISCSIYFKIIPLLFVRDITILISKFDSFAPNNPNFTRLSTIIERDI